MGKTMNWLFMVAAFIIIGGFLIAYLNFQKKPSLLFSKPSIEDLRYKDLLGRKRSNAKFVAKRDYLDYSKFGSVIFCNSSFYSWT